MAAEVERDERDGLGDAGAAPPLNQELDCNGSGGGGTRRSGRALKPTARALAHQGGSPRRVTSRPARNAQPGQLEAGEEPASEDLRGASSAEEDEVEEEEVAGIPIDCRGNRAFYVKGTFIGNNNQPCNGFVRVDDGSPRMSLSAWTTKCTGKSLGTTQVKVVDADGQTTRRLRDVLDGVSASEDEEHPTSQYRGVTWDKTSGKWQVVMSATKVGKKSIALGLFAYEDEEDAARIYDRAQIAYLGRNKVEFTNFPVQQYSHELEWLEGLGVIKFKARLKAARKKLKKAKKPVTPEAVLQEAGLPSVPGPQQQHGATPMAAEDEEIEIRKLAREGTPPPVRPATGQASRPKRSRPAARGDSKAAKRQKPAQVPPQAAAIAELRQAQALEAQRRDLQEADLKEQNEVLLAKVDGLAAKSAQQERLIAHLEQYNAHLERFKAHVLEENEELRGLLLAKEG